nr:MAG: replication initiator protein [Microviridae sp.]
MCLWPELHSNPKYKRNKKNKGNVPEMKDKRVAAVPTGCGVCIECRAQKKREWQIRLTEEVKHDNSGQMITLTFDTNNLRTLREMYKDKTPYEQDNAIATIAVRRFLERWRKEHKKSVKHWLITELGHGEFEHMHIHGILWTNEPGEKIKKIWQYGNIWAGYGTNRTYVNESTISYIIKYVTKIDEKHKYYKPIILCSPGIGSKYINTEAAKIAKKEEAYRTRTGHKIALPIYYRNKIYTEDEREKKWIEKIDKNERYVLKQKIKIDKTQDEYIKAVKEARRINQQLGYRNRETNWTEKKYEEKRRKYLLDTRVEATPHCGLPSAPLPVAFKGTVSRRFDFSCLGGRCSEDTGSTETENNINEFIKGIKKQEY